MESVAFAPGHISGFFQPVYNSDIEKTGSIGAGINLNKGAISKVKIIDDKSKKIDIFLNGIKSKSPVIRLAIQQIISDRKLNIKIETNTNLPISQGFGMSAAGALSASYAVADLLKIPLSDAVKAAHNAEVNLKTGLGDVIASSVGGIEIRKKPGIPPWSDIEIIKGNWEVIICVVDKILSTKDILNNKEMQKNIEKYGRTCMSELLKNPSIQTFFKVSEWFTRKTQLGSKKVIDSIDAVKPFGMASMCMLGNSIYSIGQTDEIIKILSEFGQVQLCNIDEKGARIIKS